MQPLGNPESDPPVVIRFFAPSPQLAPYITTYYHTEVTLPEGKQVSDWLHPEWAHLRFFNGGIQKAAVGHEPPEQVPAITLAGPTSRAVRFEAGSMRSWGIGLLPLGWAKFISAPAEEYADRFVDAATETVTDIFRPLGDLLFARGGSRPIA